MAQRYGTTRCQIEFRHDGFRKLLYGITDEGIGVDGAVEKVCEAIVRDVARAAGLSRKDYIVDTFDSEWRTSYRYPGRRLGCVMCGSRESMVSEATDKTLTRAALTNRGVIS